MKNASLYAAAAIILVANGFALVHAARNRSGEPDAQVTLTERELPYSYHRDPDDSGLDLRMAWRDNNTYAYYSPWTQNTGDDDSGWRLDEQKLRSLGFDCRIAPSDPKAPSFYSRQRPRSGFVALEYAGPAWQAWLQRYSQRAARQPAFRESFDQDRLEGSQLVVIDAASDPAALRARHPDGKSVLVVPAVFRISLIARIPPANGQPSIPARLNGTIEVVASSIHVPRPFSEGFSGLREKARYRVRIRYGKLFEPSVEGVGFAGR